MTGRARVLVVGAGFSGSLLAAELVARTEVQVILVERSGVYGRGAAYAQGSQTNLLNVRSNRMSAFAEAPNHFVEWLAKHRPGADPNSFAPRSDYGAYVADILRGVAEGTSERLIRRSAEVLSLETTAFGVAARLSNGELIQADAAVLAGGNLAPATPTAVRALIGSPRYVENPWAPGALEAIGEQDDVLLLGSGLTAVDALLDLDARGWRGQAVAVSRRGLMPHAHDARQDPTSAPPPEAGELSRQLKAFRTRRKAEPWGRLMDELRPHGQTLWRRLSPAQRRRSLRHLRPWWDIHRHRIAPEAAARIARLRTDGRLRVIAAALVDAQITEQGATITLRPRGAREIRAAAARWVVNCTGPDTDLSRTRDPLLSRLLAGGDARTDVLNLGLDTDEELRVRRSDGSAEARVFALGPLTRGVFWEITAVPDIRLHARTLAQTLGRLITEQTVSDAAAAEPSAALGEGYA